MAAIAIIAFVVTVGSDDKKKQQGTPAASPPTISAPSSDGGDSPDASVPVKPRDTDNTEPKGRE